MIKFKVKVMLALRDMTQKELAKRTGIRPPPYPRSAPER